MSVIISVAQQKGGAGKTTISTNIAVCLSNLGKKVGFIDMDPQQSATMWYQLRQDYIADNTIDLLLHDFNLKDILSEHHHKYDVLIIDTPPHAKESAMQLIRNSDFVIIPTQLSPMDIWATQPILDMAQEAQTAHFLVLNRVPYASKVSSSLHNSLIENNLPLAETAIGNRNHYVSAFLQGSGVTEHSPRSTAAFEIKKLTYALLQRIQETQKELVVKTLA